MVIGLGLGSDSIRAIAVRAGQVVWAAERTLDGDSLSHAIPELLRQAPLPRWRKAEVILAVGPSQSQIKRLTHLPPLADRRAVSQLVRESASRFFLKNGIPLVTTEVRLTAPDEAWGAAVDQPVVDEAGAACRQVGLRLRAVIPAVNVLHLALEGDRLVWADGAIRSEVTRDNGELISVRRLMHLPEDDPAQVPGVVPALTVLGDEAWRFADAYGAALLPEKEEIVFRPGRARTGSGAIPNWRLAAAVTAFCIACIAAILAPGASATMAARRASDHLAALNPRWRDALLQENELRRVTSALAEVGAFEATRYSVTLLLADLTRAIPEGSALITLRADSTGATLVALSPRAAELPSRLEKVSGLVAPQILGPVTREKIGTRDVERATIRFRIDTDRRRGQSNPEERR